LKNRNPSKEPVVLRGAIRSHLLRDQKAQLFHSFMTSSIQQTFVGYLLCRHLLGTADTVAGGKRRWIGEVWSSVSDTVQRMERQATDGEKIFASHLSVKGLYLKCVTNSQNSTMRKQPHLKNELKTHRQRRYTDGK